MTAQHSHLQEKIGHVVTRFMMRSPVRATVAGRRAYARMYLAGKHFAEKRALALFRGRITAGMTVVDMGANVGFYTRQFSRLTGPSGKVYAFEPDPFCAELLRDRMRRLELWNVQVETAALGAREGEATLYCSNRDRAENRTHPFEPCVPVETVRVPVLTLDAYCHSHRIERIDAVKMDVEGDEVSALRGMREVLTRTPPSWMFIEFCPSQLRGAGSTPEEFWALLAEHGYRPHSIESRGELRPIRDTEALTASLLGESHTNIWAVHRSAPLAAGWS